MNPTEAKAIADFLIADFEMEMGTTMRVIGAVPNDHLNYRPDPKAKTALGLNRHLPLEDEWLLNAIADGKFGHPPAEDDSCDIMNPAGAVARYKEKVVPALNRLRALSGEELIKDLDMMGAFQAPAINMLAVALKHSIHHRGQLSSYLRPMGGHVPSIFGPSADT